MKRNVKLASGVMFVSLIGLLSFQAYWISSVYKENRQNFEADAQAALNSANKSLLIQKLGLLGGLSIDVTDDNSMSITLSDKRRIGDGRSFFDFSADISTHYIVSDSLISDDIMYLNGRMKREFGISADREAILPIITNSYGRFSSNDFELLDSLVRGKLEAKGLHKNYFLGFWDKGEEKFAFANKRIIDSSSVRGFTVKAFAAGGPKTNELHLQFPKRNVLQASLAGVGPIIAASVLMLLMLLSAWYYIVRSLQKQYRLAQIKDDFIGNMTHELKTPVTASSLALEVMSKNEKMEEDPKLKNLLDVAQHEQKRILQIINSILDNTSAEESINDNAEMINVGQELEVIAESMRLKAEEKGGRLEVKVPLEEALVKANRMHFQNAILNLLDNALKYSDQEPRIMINMRADLAHVEIRVIDNGIGLSLDDKKRIFDKFFRVHTGNVHTVKGYGLGLSYTKSVIEQFGGTIQVESKKGEGSTFIVKLPKAQHES